MARDDRTPDLFGAHPERQERRPTRRATTKSTLFPKAHFNGPEYVPERDDARLTGQIERIFMLMRDGVWRTVTEIAAITRDPQTSISAQLRHLRKPRFGAHTVERRSRKGALHEYRLILNEDSVYR